MLEVQNPEILFDGCKHLFGGSLSKEKSWSCATNQLLSLTWMIDKFCQDNVGTAPEDTGQNEMD